MKLAYPRIATAELRGSRLGRHHLVAKFEKIVNFKISNLLLPVSAYLLSQKSPGLVGWKLNLIIFRCDSCHGFEGWAGIGSWKKFRTGIGTKIEFFSRGRYRYQNRKFRCQKSSEVSVFGIGTSATTLVGIIRFPHKNHKCVFPRILYSFIQNWMGFQIRWFPASFSSYRWDQNREKLQPVRVAFSQI